MAKTERNKQNTPKSCMYRIKVIRKLRFLISSKIVLFSFSSYIFFKLRTIDAIVKKRLVYASSINEVAENSKAGVSMFKVIVSC